MRQKPQAYFPFEPFLKELREDGLRLGTDSYLLVQELMEAYAAEETYPTVEVLQVQLRALLVSSQEEANLFDERFEAYVSRFEIQVPEEEGSGQTGGGAPSTRGFPLVYLWALLPLLLGLIWLGLRSQARLTKIPVNGISFSITQPLHWQTLRLQWTDSYSYPKWAVRNAPEPDAWLWTFPNGDTSQQAQPVYHFVTPGPNPVLVQAIFADGDTLSTLDTVEVRPIRRMQVDFDFHTNEQQDSLIFEQKSTFYQGETARPWDTLIAPPEFRWELEGMGSYQGPRLRLPFQSRGFGTVSYLLIVTARWADTTVVDSVQRENQFVIKPDVPSLKPHLLKVNISDLIKQADDWNLERWILLMSLLLSYLVLEAILGYRRKVSLDESPKRGPPFREELDLAAPPLDFFHTQPFYLLTRRLRQRRIGGLRPRPDVAKSIQKTIASGGFPSLSFGIRTEPSQYLLLVEQHSPEDHLAKLFAELGKELASRDISVEVWFYRRSPEYCWREGKSQRVPLQRLRNLYPGYRLLLIGEGEHFLHRQGSGLQPWVSELETWTERAFLSTRPTEAWGRLEQIIHQEMLVVPATQIGFTSLVEQWLAEEPRTPAEWKQLHYEANLPEESGLSQPVELRAYLGASAFHWLVACAWYPETAWGLSLRFAKRVESLSLEGPPLRLGLDELVRMFRLPFFREGSFPRDLREKLVTYVPEELSIAARDLLIQLLEEARHQAPEASYAEADQQVRLALFRFLNSKREKSDRKALQATLKTIHPSDIADHLNLKELGKIRSPLTIPLPARMFWGNIPLLGLKQRIRLLIGLPIFALLLSGNFLWQRARQTPEWDETRSYAANELVFPNGARDSARWYVHEGYLLEQQDSLELAQPGLDKFQQAVSAYPDDTALYNLALTRFSRARQAYQQDQFGQVSDALIHQEGMSLFPISPGAESSVSLAIPQLWFPLIQGLASSQLRDSLLEAEYLYQALCEANVDPAYQARMRDSLRLETEFRRLIDRSGAEHLTALRACLDWLLQANEGYELRIRTGYITRAQTDGLPLFATLMGSLGRDTLRLDDPEQGNQQFESNRLDSWRFRSRRQLGALDTLLIWTSDPRPGVNDWLIQSVTLSDYYQEREYQVNEVASWLGDKGSWELPIPLETTFYSGWTIGAKLFHQPSGGTREQVVGEYEVLLWAGEQRSSATSFLQRPTENSGNFSFTMPYQLRERRLDSMLLRIQAEGYLPLEKRYALRDLPRLDEQFFLVKEGEILDVVSVDSLFLPDIRVEDETGNPIPNATLRIQGKTFRSDSEGRFPIAQALSGLSPIRLQIEAFDHQPLDTALTVAELLQPVVGKLRLNAPSSEPEEEIPPAPRMIWIQGGSFEMGSSAFSFESFNDEQPVHTVRVPSFELAEAEVTFAQYDYFCEQTGREKPADEGWGRGNRPVINLSWADAKAYCAWYSQQTGQAYRLPTEAEWEYAAGGGAYGRTKYAGTNNKRELEQYAVFDKNSGGRTSPVKSKRPNQLGLYDMSGNVWEWCEDKWYRDYDNAPTDGSAMISGKGGRRLGRGGGWSNGDRILRVTNRFGNDDGIEGRSLGFRLARSVDTALQVQPPKMIRIPGGTFFMGSPEGEGEADERPEHPVTVSEFYLGETEVTVGQYLIFCQATDTHWPEWLEAGNDYHVETGTDSYYKDKGYTRRGSETLPIVGVSWHDAVAYAEWLSKETGQRYRLPSEAEWEYAAGGGTLERDSAGRRRYVYSGRDDLDAVGWYYSNSNSRPQAVRTKQPNALGLYDMSGNVWEWCGDWYGENYYGGSELQNPKGPKNGYYRVLRGGSWLISPINCRVALRGRNDPNFRNVDLGFRVARDLP